MPALRSYALNKDCLGGALVASVGAIAIAAVRKDEFGALDRMGPAFFPSVVGATMIIVGSAIALVGVGKAASDRDRVLTLDLRAWGLVPLSLFAFIVVGAFSGLLPATFAIVSIAALADRHNTWQDIVLLAAIMTVTCLVVFWWGLQVQFPLFHFGFGE
ncbi:tripartite tricarboxylate transporter TctB family protein [Bradyrhizobium sp. 6(2017)]|uniref:tripartite tricarboxylate transporter TctB family protein n=1 Tax=Bradyrhizobium sp. 6(2017) TaxID=1197460 RepID=UPI0013E13C89|nr:tripartite tricarboxylate transporter TctB family protein [Bradyrhizobium sp. 6(2017)]QIG97675.1 tripartite tricarboxylate transporter TctB family protein [Bradyrhizobium sp. 6(2017)]